MHHQNPYSLERLAAPGLGLLGAATTLTFSQASVVGIACAVTLIGLSVGTMLWRQRHERLDAERLKQFMSSQKAFGAKLAPVWSGQIEQSRSQMETAVAALASRFSGIVIKLERALGRADVERGEANGHGSADAATVYAKSQEELQVILVSLRQAMAGKAEMLDRVQGLQSFVKELDAMASAVSRIAQQTNLLAINAAIEAAHAGDSGRGFATVAQEVRSLSRVSGETGRLIASKIDVINDAIASTRLAAESTEQQESQLLTESEARISEVLASFGGLTHSLAEAAEELRHESRSIQAEVNEALVQLQFQDRIGQILGHVSANIGRFPSVVEEQFDACEREGELRPLQAKGLLSELEATYAMSDERTLHSNNTASATPKAAAPDEVTFF